MDQNHHEHEIDKETMRKYGRPTTWLTGPQMYLVLVRAFQRQIGVTLDQAHRIVMSRFPMSIGGVVDEVATRGLSVTTVDVEDYASRILDAIPDPRTLVFGPGDVEDFITWAVTNRRSCHSPQQWAVADLQENENFMEAANEIASKMEQARQEETA